MLKSQDKTCPDRSLISDYLSGRLDDSAAEHFEQHLESCECCVAALSMTPPAAAEPTWLGMARATARSSSSSSALSQTAHAEAQLDPSGKQAEAGHTSVRYSWIRKIGSGGMGEVWEGWDHMMRRPVALKKLKHHQSETSGAQRLLQEAIVLSRLSHPHIVTVHEIILEHSQPVLVMEYIPGMTLAEWQSGRPLRQQDAAAVVRVLAQALQHAHDHSVIHRDLKPSNVLLRTENRDELPRDQTGELCLWLSDFGLARAIDDPSFTGVGQVLGTPFYMPPEQAGEEHLVDARSDLYGLGAILYELLTGIPPFMGNDKAVLLQRIRTEDPVAPRRLQPRLSRDIETICLKCLSRRPADRYPTAAAVTADLEAFLEGRPIVARPVSIATRLLRWCSRNPIIATLTLSTATAFLFAAVFAVSAAHEQTQKLSITIEAADREKELRQRAEVAEQAAKRREQNELRLRQQYQNLLVKIVTILDDNRLNSTAATGDANPSSTDRVAATSVTRQLLDAVFPVIKESGNQPTWSELEVAARFLALRLFQKDPTDLAVLIDKVDQCLEVHRHSPEDPEAFVEFMWTRQHFFDVSVNAVTDRQDKSREWLQLASQFLSQAVACEPGNPRIAKLLNARIQALVYVRDLWRPQDALTAEGRQISKTVLEESIRQLEEPLPHAYRATDKQQQLLLAIRRDLQQLPD
jgi:serine/threonine protein kinase